MTKTGFDIGDHVLLKEDGREGVVHGWSPSGRPTVLVRWENGTSNEIFTSRLKRKKRNENPA